jgi:hypothetical protein
MKYWRDECSAIIRVDDDEGKPCCTVRDRVIPL